MKTVFIKLKKAGPNSGPFDILSQRDEILLSDISKKELVAGIALKVEDDDVLVKMISQEPCSFTKVVQIGEMVMQEFVQSPYVENTTGCAWRHLTNTQLYNSYYGVTKPYIIEYPFSYKMQDEIVQNVKDYTKAYSYLPNEDGVFSYNTKVETDNIWFNKSVLYNGQQSSGTLFLVPKPLHNMKELMSYPKYHTDGKTILFTKSDNFYQYNTFWALQKTSQVPLFKTSCESLSIDKVVNDDNMDYSVRSFNKSPLRAKELRIRHILDDKSDIHLVSQFVLVPTQISFK